MNSKIFAALFTIAVVSATGPLDPAKQLLEGVYRGFASQDLPNEDACLNDNDQTELINLLSKLVNDVNVNKGDSIIYGDCENVFNDVVPFYDGCGLSKVVNDVVSYVNSQGYVGLVKHAIKHSTALIGGIQEIGSDLEKGDYYEAGRILGTSVLILLDGKCSVIEQLLFSKY